jgi:3,4-dihydroxy 2-butanone 4-phosphate synthase/GTP cyclohydrolase II
VLVILGAEAHGAELLARVKGFEAADKGLAPEGAKWQGTSRRVGVGSQILKALGVGKMRLLSSPKKYHALGGFGLEVVEYVGE